ncbi:MAG TPA: endolytic transglycosylase MltG [Thermoleophilaceae bacterium]|nr:endolytic transglycosylase MltG [Thermoleophilaceae bacterium]
MSGRTPEERERARLEREAKRAAERGEPPPPPPDPTPPTEPPPPADPPPAAPAEPPPPDPPPAARDADRSAAANRVMDRVRRQRGPSNEQRATSNDPRPATSDQRPARTSRRSTRFKILLAVGVVLALAAAWFLLSLFQPFKGDGEGTVPVQIPTGASVTEIGEILEENDVIASEMFFRARVTIGGSRGDLKPGAYQLARDMSYGAAIDALSEGPPKDIITITIPEGRSRAEIAPLVEAAGISGSYRRASAGSEAIDLRRYDAANADSLEGFLFPATYELKRGADATDLVTKQVEAFEDQFAGVDLRFAERKNLTPYDVLIIASMVEREAGVDKDRPLIASVIYNRLRLGEPLGIDATLRFALNNWTEPLTVSELASDSPYNTRKFANLPPGPIGNPGLASIKAAANPADTDFVFFVVKPCGEGEHAFAATDAEHQQNVARYDAEREAQGGQSPTEC